MKLSKYTFILLFLVVVTSLGVLLYNQYRILEQDIETNRNVMSMAVPDILSDLYDNSMYNDDLRDLVDDIRGTDSFVFTNTSEVTDPLQLKLKTEIDKVLALNYPNFDYRVDGYTSSEYGCMIHRGNWPVQPEAKNVMAADNHLCFCMIYPKKLDIAMTYTNKGAAVLGESADIIRTSLILIVVILGAFGYTIYTINKQKKLSDLKRDFINNLTHEFKTPIFSISLAAKSLKAKEEVKTSEKMTSYVNLIGAESKRLQTQVDKILQMAMLDSGNLHLEKKTFDLHEVIRQVADSFTMIIAEKQGEIKLSLLAKRHLITADETHIKNVLYNLIDNAQKYTNGAPKINISTSDTAQDGILLVVKDHGIGIDERVQKYIFDQFYRAQQGDIHTVKGFGLGLSYVKRIVEFHMGTISLKSQPGAGSEFSIFLPQVS
ncbi:HAMP domain-containing sensor histidine kinase [uncultured Imperialibacter sp.]|uniref:sensor histidine kinase n=1 Tax=uncultured Imperialibacter sp. TaxID=1672639 RepID=UPI0030DC56BE|tara:strand:+ start:2096 stop:3391 length:1296 start_codon:yes stop_codon:yes gene_type:complete